MTTMNTDPAEELEALRQLKTWLIQQVHEDQSSGLSRGAWRDIARYLLNNLNVQADELFPD